MPLLIKNLSICFGSYECFILFSWTHWRSSFADCYYHCNLGSSCVHFIFKRKCLVHWYFIEELFNSNYERPPLNRNDVHFITFETEDCPAQTSMSSNLNQTMKHTFSLIRRITLRSMSVTYSSCTLNQFHCSQADNGLRHNKIWWYWAESPKVFP